MRLYPGFFWFVMWWVVLPGLVGIKYGWWAGVLYLLAQLVVFLWLVWQMLIREGEQLWETNAP